MTLLARAARLLKADLHGVLDTLEEPLSVLRQAIRDMQAVIEQTQSQLEQSERRHEQVSRVVTIGKQRLSELQRQIDLCFDEQNDALAKSFIGKKLDLLDRFDQLAEQQRDGEEQSQALRARLAEHQAQLEAVLEQQAMIPQIPNENRANATIEEPYPARRRSSEAIEIAFLEEKRRRQAQASEA